MRRLPCAFVYQASGGFASPNKPVEFLVPWGRSLAVSEPAFPGEQDVACVVRRRRKQDVITALQFRRAEDWEEIRADV